MGAVPVDASAYFYVYSVNSGLTEKVLIDICLENIFYAKKFKVYPCFVKKHLI